MLRATVHSFVLAWLLVGSLTAATDAFVGKWKLNQSKSKMNGMVWTIKEVAGNKYAITFPPGDTPEIADGTDQPPNRRNFKAVSMIRTQP